MKDDELFLPREQWRQAFYADVASTEDALRWDLRQGLADHLAERGLLLRARGPRPHRIKGSAAREVALQWEQARTENRVPQN